MTHQAQSMVDQYLNQLKRANVAIEILEELVQKDDIDGSILELKIWPNSSDWKAAGYFLQRNFTPLSIVEHALNQARREREEAREQIKKWSELI